MYLLKAVIAFAIGFAIGFGIVYSLATLFELIF